MEEPIAATQFIKNPNDGPPRRFRSHRAPSLRFGVSEKLNFLSTLHSDPPLSPGAQADNWLPEQ
jgi:hypothetical protein